MSAAGSIAGLFARRILPGFRDVVFGLFAAAASYLLLKPHEAMLPVVFIAATMASYSVRLMLRVARIWRTLRSMDVRDKRGLDTVRGALGK